MSETFDVIVVGGGPAGSTVATLVARRGHRVLLLEKAQFPRYQIGESLLPSTIHGICALLGVRDEVARAGFTVKRGGTFLWGSNPQPWTFSFGVSPKMAGPTATAFQVERMKFDEILLRNAEREGVVVREQSTVVGVLEDAAERITGVRYRHADGEGEAHATIVVDASGSLSRIHGSVGGTRRYSDFFRNLAVFGYFEGGARLPEPNSGNIYCAAFDSGWFWYIPLSPTLTSVGAVISPDHTSRVQGSPERALTELIAECPSISAHLASARRVTEGPYGHVRIRKDYSYCADTFWRPGMALVGDAACFVDPVFSSGVHLATYGALLTARAINSTLAGTVPQERAFAECERRYRKEYGVFYEFLVSFYSLHAEENSYFWQAKKTTGCDADELRAFVELVGGVSNDDAALRVADRLGYASRELETALAGTGPGFLRSTVVSNAMRESAELQASALLGFHDAPAPASSELALAPDGLSWLIPTG